MQLFVLWHYLDINGMVFHSKFERYDIKTYFEIERKINEPESETDPKLKDFTKICVHFQVR